jgi:hypothetical protein
MYKLFFLLFVGCSFFQCKPESNANTGKLELIFKATYNDNPLVLYEKDSTNSNNPLSITFKKLDFFVSDIKIEAVSNDWKYIKDAGYITMANNLTPTAALQGFRFVIDEVPIGDYQGLELGIGLSDQVNGTLPGDYASSSPLGLNANYWASWESYILCKIEGDIEQSNGSTSGFLYHAGVNGMHQIKNFMPSFSISSNTSTSIVFEIKAEQLFFKNGTEIDLINDNQTHSGQTGSDAYNLAEKAIQNLSNSIYIP